LAQRGIILRSIDWVGRVLRTTALVVASTLILFVLANLGAALYLNRGQPVDSPEARARARSEAVIARYGIDFFKRVYPDKTEAEIRQIIFDQPTFSNAYEPFVEFRSAAIASPTMNIHQAGFRLIGAQQGPWPLDDKAVNVFVFGGSTTIGSGVEDSKTIPAALQVILREKTKDSGRVVNVYNFGVGAYFSSQEVTYFQNQLRNGHLPDIVVFVDGLNDFHYWDGDPSTAKNSRQSFYLIQSMSQQLGREQGVGWHLVELLNSLPFVKLARQLGQPVAPPIVGPDRETLREQMREKSDAAPFGAPLTRIAENKAGTPTLSDAGATPADERYSSRYQDDPQVTDPGKVRTVIRRYLTNKDIAQGIARQLGIEAIFAWQPVPLYKYDLALHPFRIQDEHRRHRYGYPAMARYVATHDIGANFAWCADGFQGAKRSLYVDQVHYTTEGNRLNAECIADNIVASGALARAMQRKGGEAPAEIARRDLEAIVEADTRTSREIGRLFGPQATTGSLEMSKPLIAWGDIATSGVRLTDASASFGVIYEYFPLEPSLADRTHEISIRIKPATSDYLGLAMICVGGANAENQVMFVNPQTMGVIAATGDHDVSAEPGGWTRVTMTGTCKDVGNDRMQIALYPAHGAAEARGAIIFGGGEIRRVVAVPTNASTQGSR
jgi:lysophospholipase L1-like esterase